MFDFSPVQNKEKKLIDLVADVTPAHLRQYTEESISFLLSLLADLNDADVTFDPIDPDADDPHAAPGEEKIGWSLAHLVAHVTATSEEWAAYASVLARGVAYPAEPRLRYETPWRDITTHAQCIQRLEESRRIRLGYLDTFPDAPFYETRRTLSPRFIEYAGEMNALSGFLFGLMHEVGHYAQFQEVRRQALAAKAQATE